MSGKKPKLEDWQTDRALKKRACMIGYNATKGAISPLMPRGWLVREYHSRAARKMHLKCEVGEGSYGDAGPFRTEQEAREYALGAA
jgi:hypothetical protein